MRTDRDGPTICAGGVALIAGAVAFLAVFSAVWALYGLLPLVWVPAGVGAVHGLRPVREGSTRAAMLFAVVAAISMMLGLLRWPSVHWTLAQAYVAGDASAQALIAAVFAGLNSYLGNNIGEFLSELSVSLFFLLSVLAMVAPRARFPPWSLRSRR